MKTHCIAGLLVGLLSVPGGAEALEANWPQWRGPDRMDVSQETGLLREWPDGGPPRAWLFHQTGIGYSGPAVVGDVLLIMGAREGVEHLLALDTSSGTERWSAEIGPMFENGWGDGPRGTPTVDGSRVYALGAQGNLICARLDDGSILWKRSLQELGGTTPNWGYAESVLIDGPRLICTPGGSEGTIAALDKMTGQRLWQSSQWTDGAQYASPIVLTHDGVRQYVQLTMQHFGSVSADDGKLLWTSDWPGRTAVIPTPIYHQGRVFVTSGYSAGCKLVQLEAGQQITDVYANRNMKNHHGGVLLVGDHLYGYSDGRGWVCQEFATGKVIWSEKRKLGKGSLTCADGMLYCLEERGAAVALIEASPDGWREHGRFQLEPLTELRKPRGGVWTHPVVAGGRLYLRDQELLFCYDVRQGAGGP